MTTTDPKVDVVTVGAGWTSNILGWKLTAAGLTVTALEQGPNRWTFPDYAHDHDSIAYQVRKRMMSDISKETWTWRPNPRSSALPIRQFQAFHPGSGLGGSAMHWSGMLWRFLPSDFKYRSHYVERYGPGKLPDGNTIQDWPISYDELEPYYDAFEWDIGASGQAGNLRGDIVEGGNPFEGPRRRPYPNPPLVATAPSYLFKKACEELGYHPFPQPSGILSRAYHDPLGNYRSGCMYCGFCTRFGCEVDAKSTGVTTHLRPALATGRYVVRTGAHVTKINTVGGQATGVTYVDCDGVERFQPADVVIASGYPLGNVKLLLVSRSSDHPNGVGNDRNMVGRNFTYQIWQGPVTGLWEKRRWGLYMGNTSTIFDVYDLNGDNFDHSNVDFVGGAAIMAVLGEYAPAYGWSGFPALDGSTYGKSFVQQYGKWWDSMAPINVQGESLPYVDQFMDLDPHYTDAWGNPLLRLTFDWHENDQKMYAFVAKKAIEIMKVMNPDTIADSSTDLGPFQIPPYQSTHITGGAIMGDAPDTSVTNSYGQVWDTPNVFVTGATLYPQNPGANPTGTLCALAYRTGDAIVERYVNAPGELMS
jgi:gluconate 2-dehydrogenase alpha chain